MYRVEKDALEIAQESAQRAWEEFQQERTKEAFYRYREANRAYITILRNYYRV